MEAQLHAAVSELSTALLSGPSILTAFDAAAQQHLALNDELMALVDSARLEIQHTTDVAFANLLSQTQVRGGRAGLQKRPAPAWRACAHAASHTRNTRAPRSPSHPPLPPPGARRSCWRCTQ